jgi:hypothetical protein
LLLTRKSMSVLSTRKDGSSTTIMTLGQYNSRNIRKESRMLMI